MRTAELLPRLLFAVWLRHPSPSAERDRPATETGRWKSPRKRP